MDPLAATAALVAVSLAGTAWAGWYYGRRIRRVEALAARLRRQLQAEYHAANHDPLTGLPNRRGLFRLGEPLLAEAGRTPVAALVIDLDDFKQANDRFGHATGDQVLVTIANRLATWVSRLAPARTGPRDRPGRPSAVVARLGGDEFAGLFTAPTTDHGWLQQAAWQLSHELGAPIDVNGRRVRVSASVGLTAVPTGMTLAEALHRADEVMYRAKAGGAPLGGATPLPA
ncbi:MAG TPA: GGDEF domain-containing protein [Natronosporangium sp.]